MKKLILLSVVLFALSSCDSDIEYIEGSSGMNTISSHGIKYFKDSRTGLCFAERGSINSYTMTCVPCSEEVEKLIK